MLKKKKKRLFSNKKQLLSFSKYKMKPYLGGAEGFIPSSEGRSIIPPAQNTFITQSRRHRNVSEHIFVFHKAQITRFFSIKLDFIQLKELYK